jgi:hypothetical protein
MSKPLSLANQSIACAAIGNAMPVSSAPPLQYPLNVVLAVDDPGFGIQLDYDRIGVI